MGGGSLLQVPHVPVRVLDAVITDLLGLAASVDLVPPSKRVRS